MKPVFNVVVALLAVCGMSSAPLLADSSGRFDVTMFFEFGIVSYTIRYEPLPPPEQRFTRLAHSPDGPHEYGGAYGAPNGYAFCKLVVVHHYIAPGATFHITWQNNMAQFAYYAAAVKGGQTAGGRITFTLYPRDHMPKDCMHDGPVF
jgi:hypothetical protein